jgi:DNA-binding LacI/PurR family transcriptional regulator
MFDTKFRVNKDDPLPRHAQVQRILREMVTSGQLKPGDKIPAELQIAEALGVSKMTVNKALLALAASGLFVREVGRGTFVASLPNLPARPAGRRLRITLSFVEGAGNLLESHYYGTMYRGISDYFGASGLDLDVALTPLAARDYLAEDERDPADGRLIIAPRAESIPSIEALWQKDKAVIVVGASWPSMRAPSVDSDNVGGAIEAVQYLAHLGHRRIALLYAEAETANTQDRMVGYRRALSLARLVRDPVLEVEAEANWKAGDSARQRLARLLAGEEPVTAVFAAGYHLALDAMNVIREAGLRIPEDGSVVGYDDPVSAELVYPPLTTIRQPLFDMGQRAAERLLRLVRGEAPRAIIRETLPAQLVVRGSTAPAAAQRMAA